MTDGEKENLRRREVIALERIATSLERIANCTRGNMFNVNK